MGVLDAVARDTRPDRIETPSVRDAGSPAHTWIWTAFVVAALLLLDIVGGASYALVVTGAALLLSFATHEWRVRRAERDQLDLIWIIGLYAGVVVLFKLAFGVFSTGRTLPMFLSFAGGMLLGTVGPIVYTVWIRGRTLTSIGLGLHDIGPTIRLALLFGAVQFSITLWGVELPVPRDWVPLLVMALTTGIFESIFFRGFLQGRLESSLGRAPGVAAAAVLYGLYHVGYGMSVTEIAFLTGLGLVYAIAYAQTRNLLVLWPLLTPLGSFYALLNSGELVGQLPRMSILGFIDVTAVIVTVLFVARRHVLRSERETTAADAVGGV
jgi:uncharacterized protein